MSRQCHLFVRGILALYFIRSKSLFLPSLISMSVASAGVFPLSCWCGYETPSPILSEANSAIQNQEEAIGIVKNYLQENHLMYDIQRAVQLNTVFYNVFAYDEYADEVVYTVAADGTIIKTICGV